MKQPYLFFLILGIFLCMTKGYGEGAGAYEQGDYLLHPTELYFKEEAVLKMYAYVAARTQNGCLNEVLAWKENDKEEEFKGGVRLINEKEQSRVKGIRIKTLTSEGLSVEFKIRTEQALGKGSFGEIGFYIPEEFLQSSDYPVICIDPNGKETDISSKKKFRDVILDSKQGKGTFILRGRKYELIINITGIDFTGSYGARLQDFRISPIDGIRSFRFLISFCAANPFDLNIEVRFNIKELSG